MKKFYALEKIILAFAFLLCTACGGEPFLSTFDNSIKSTAVVFVIGQSNASSAKAFVKDLNSADRDLEAYTGIFIQTDDGIAQYQPGVNAGGPLKFGPEIRVSKELLKHYDQVLVLKYAAGSTSIYEQADAFDYNINSSGEAFDQMMSVFDSAIIQATFKNWALHNVGYVWIHGEADKNKPEWAQAYSSNVLALEQELRKKYDWEDRTPPFVVTELSPIIKNGDHQLIREQQRLVANQSPAGVFINTDGLGLADNVHYNSVSILALSEILKSYFH